jgi:hypothetical protein
MLVPIQQPIIQFSLINPIKLLTPASLTHARSTRTHTDTPLLFMIPGSGAPIWSKENLVLQAAITLEVPPSACIHCSKYLCPYLNASWRSHSVRLLSPPAVLPQSPQLYQYVGLSVFIFNGGNREMSQGTKSGK